MSPAMMSGGWAAMRQRQGTPPPRSTEATTGAQHSEVGMSGAQKGIAWQASAEGSHDDDMELPGCAPTVATVTERRTQPTVAAVTERRTSRRRRWVRSIGVGECVLLYWLFFFSFLRWRVSWLGVQGSLRYICSDCPGITALLEMDSEAETHTATDSVLSMDGSDAVAVSDGE